jgi:hypothetical protein
MFVLALACLTALAEGAEIVQQSPIEIFGPSEWPPCFDTRDVGRATVKDLAQGKAKVRVRLDEGLPDREFSVHWVSRKIICGAGDHVRDGRVIGTFRTDSEGIGTFDPRVEDLDPGFPFTIYLSSPNEHPPHTYTIYFKAGPFILRPDQLPSADESGE